MGVFSSEPYRFSYTDRLCVLPSFGKNSFNVNPRLFGILRTFVKKLSANQHSANFAGTGADLVQLGIAEQAPGGIVVDVTVTA
jgi:hypothetical protein